jgi:formylglycine-generating enzyme required for sulfatase activity
VQHKVTISKDYYLGVTEVTQGQYEKVMGTNPSKFQKQVILNKDSSMYPVEKVTWEDAVSFCKRLSELPDEKKAGRVYRLPTEAEWEYACRAEIETAFGGFDVSGRHLGHHRHMVHMGSRCQLSFRCRLHALDDLRELGPSIFKWL